MPFLWVAPRQSAEQVTFSSQTVGGSTITPYFWGDGRDLVDPGPAGGSGALFGRHRIEAAARRSQDQDTRMFARKSFGGARPQRSVTLLALHKSRCAEGQGARSGDRECATSRQYPRGGGAL